MRHIPIVWNVCLRVVGAASATLMAGCAQTSETAPSALAPQGPAAAQIAGLWWIMLGLSTIIFLLVMGLLAWGLWRKRPIPANGSMRALRDESESALPGGANTWIMGGGVILPVIVLTGLLVLTLGAMRAIARVSPSQEIVIEVIGHQWWWEIRYPNHGFTTANEIRIPVGQPIELQLTSNDVIHSFWAPELHGKMDLVPGRTTTWVVQADQVGDYRAECAEFCGLQHAKMHLIVVAEPPDKLAEWLANEQQEAVKPASDAERSGQQVFLGSACANCHAIRGTNASGVVGPDLTHLASRRTLAAGALPNTRGHLAGWIIDPQNLKPGNLMPPTQLSGEELNALLAYLESLK
ncbi:MAG: cytochrome c oxidase subunit II [Anaerolineales bacterium]